MVGERTREIMDMEVVQSISHHQTTTVMGLGKLFCYREGLRVEKKRKKEKMNRNGQPWSTISMHKSFTWKTTSTL